MNRFALRRIVDLNARAKQFEELGLYEKSISAREEICQLLERHWGTDHVWRISRLLDLASAYKLSGNLSRAEELYEDAIQRLGQREGDNLPHQDLARGLNALGVLYCESERISLGIELFERALAISEDQGRTLARAAVLNNLASAHHTLGHLAQAETFYLEVLEIYESTGEETLLQQAHCHCDLAELAADAKRPVESERKAQEAQAFYRKAVSDRDPTLARALVRLSRLYQRLRRSTHAVALLEEAAVIFQQDCNHEQELSHCLDLMSELRHDPRSFSVGTDG